MQHRFSIWLFQLLIGLALHFRWMTELLINLAKQSLLAIVEKEGTYLHLVKRKGFKLSTYLFLVCGEHFLVIIL